MTVAPVFSVPSPISRGPQPAPPRRVALSGGGVALVWAAVLQGRWSAVDAADGQRAALVPVASADRAARRLTPREQQIATAIAEGASGKALAYDMGISCSNVSHQLRRALRKLGLRSVEQLVTLRGACRPPAGSEPPVLLRSRGWAAILLASAPSQPPDLPPALLRVAHALVSGLTLRRIAEGRGTSMATVAKQCCALYRRLGVTGRRGLVAKLTAPASPCAATAPRPPRVRRRADA